MNHTCPCCGRHCAQDQLQCHRGREYFSSPNPEHSHRGDRPQNPEDKIIILLRQCGHLLHHNFGSAGAAVPLPNTLTEEERKTLEALLEKCLNSWKNLGQKND